MYRAGLESILGLQRQGATFAIEPCVPQAWPAYSLICRFGESPYAIAVENPLRRSRGVAKPFRDPDRRGRPAA